MDRGGAVDERGDELNRNRLVAVASAIALEGNPGGTIVTDSITSSGLKEYIEQTLGGRHHRFKRGYRNVINEALRLNREGVNCPLAIETSGHAALREKLFPSTTSAYLVTKIIIKLAVLRREGKKLEDLLAGLREPAEATELRMAISEPDFRACGKPRDRRPGAVGQITRLADCAGTITRASAFRSARARARAGSCCA